MQSVQRQLTWALSLAIGLVALLGAGLAFWAAYDEARELQDDALARVAQLVARQLAQAPAMPLGFAIQGDEDDSRIHIARLGADAGAPLALPSDLAPGWHTLNAAENSWRVLVARAPNGESFAVLQDMRLRNELARYGALRTVLPFVLLIPVLLLLVAELLRKLFAPIALLAHEVDARSESDLHPIPEAGVPTEVRAFVRAINRLLARVQQAMAAQQRFIADATHELRTPLAALSLQAQRLQALALPSTAQERLAELRQGMERSRHLLDQLLGLARAQAQDQTQANPPAPAALPLHLPTLVRELLQELLPLAEAKGIDLGLAHSWDATAQQPLRIPPTALYMVLKNLLDNAIRYTPQGGCIDLALHCTPTQLCLQVQDNGPGIPAAQRARVLEPFYRLPGSTAEGSGLGLAIVHTLVQRLGGTVVLDDAAGGGLCVRVQLPVAPPGAQDAMN
ncbi:MAG: ATP-binding protein [Comamonadaceae bacterium]|nr:ATP-binding protein [Comamonadaceae bacterium]